MHCEALGEDDLIRLKFNINKTNINDAKNYLITRNTIYKKQFPTGTRLEVKGLAVKGKLIEIGMKAHKAK